MISLNQIGTEELQQMIDLCESGVLYVNEKLELTMFSKPAKLILELEKKDIGIGIHRISGFRRHNQLLEYILHVFKVKRKKSYKLEGTDEADWKVNIMPYYSQQKEFRGCIVSFYDISNEKKVKKQLEIEKEKYKILAELTDCALWEYDPNTKVLKHTRKLRGKNSLSDLIIKDYRDSMIKNGWVHPDDIELFMRYCDSMDKGETLFEYELRIMSDMDNYIWVRYQGTSIKDDYGKAFKVIGKTINIDSEIKKREQLIVQANYDQLTKLLNRSAIEERIRRELVEKENTMQALYLIDIDNFKELNSKYGHLYGDVVLECFANYLRSVFSTTNIIGRLGGDEFVGFMSDIKREQNVIDLATMLTQSVSSNLNKQIGREITISIGVAIAPKDGTTFEDLYLNADKALYRVKNRTKNGFELYDSSKQYDLLVVNPVFKQSTITFGKTKNPISPFVQKRLLDFALEVMCANRSVSTALKIIFAEAGKFYGLSRIAILEEELHSKSLMISFQWAKNELEEYRLANYEKADGTIESYSNYFDKRNMIVINNVKESDLPNQMKRNLLDNSIQSTIQCGVVDGIQSVAVIQYGIDEEHIWTDLEIDTLATLTKIISIYLLRIRNKKQLSNEIFYTKAMANNQNIYHYAVNKDTYELSYISEFAARLYPKARIGEVCYKEIAGRDKPCDTCPIPYLEKEKKESKYSVESYDEQSEAWYSTTASYVTQEDENTVYLLCRSDVTNFLERVKARDSLTGLQSLSKFEAEVMKDLVVREKRVGYALVSLDIDKFKYINDEWGYHFGDDILKILSTTIKNYLRDGELLCRAVNDKFLLWLKYENRNKLLRRYERILEQLERRFQKNIGNYSVVVTAGVYFIEKEDSILSLAIDRANIARKLVKGYHKSTYAVFSEELNNKIFIEKTIEKSMVDALKAKEFVVYYQPKVQCKTHQVIGAEALVRWMQKDSYVVPPSLFIPIFERNGFITELDFYIYERVLKEMREWMLQGKRMVPISVNVSKHDIETTQFIERFDVLVEKYQVPKRYLELEISESLMFSDIGGLLSVCKSLRNAGFKVSLDDFGSGFSSLNILKSLPIDMLKLDREFFMDSKMDERGKIVITTIIQLAKGLGIEVVCEGVETEEQVQFLSTTECDMIQGEYFYSPLEKNEYELIVEQ